MSEGPAPPNRDLARALTHARVVLRAGIETHKRSISAHRRSVKELKGALAALEDESKRLGIRLLIDDQDTPGAR